ncbi:MAG: AraC family transcriptional regulator [Rhizobacter sp.]|nr:AraC family transcriptional regulator [Ferruginibacter sp.]
MNFQVIDPGKPISLFVKNILVFEDQQPLQKTVLPFFADGYPGIIFHETTNGLLVNPYNVMMAPLFLYGQTIKPIELEMTSAYKLIIFQLCPFMIKGLLNIMPSQLTDNCYDLHQLQNGEKVVKNLQRTTSTKKRIEIIGTFLLSILQEKQEGIDSAITFALKKIIDQKGQLSVKEIHEELNLTERTFERRFVKAVGIPAKKFARIIQFQESLEQLTVKEYTRLSDIVYENGFADQSHFIKVFKAFTGKTPLAFSSRK